MILFFSYNIFIVDCGNANLHLAELRALLFPLQVTMKIASNLKSWVENEKFADSRGDNQRCNTPADDLNH